MTPGAYLCVDETMNQWLGKDMPNLKKVPRKPHSIGQEFKTIADVKTCCILRLDLTGDARPKKFDDVYSLKTVASVCRLTELWFHSGRTAIGDSWFGSPFMVRTLRERGLFSIMHVKKKRYWPKSMPDQDLLSILGEEFGSTACLKSLTDGIFVAAVRDRQPKVVIASCGTTLPGSTIQRNINGTVMTMQRPAVFDIFEEGKGMHILYLLAASLCNFA